MNIGDGNYIATPSGILLPNGTHAKIQKNMLNAQKAMRGQFFSDYAYYSTWDVAGGQDKPADEVSFKFLRDALQTSAIDQLLVDARKFQGQYVARRCMNPQTQVGFRVRHKRHHDPDFKPNKGEKDDIDKRCREVEEVILHPNPHLFPGGYRDVLPMTFEEELVIDRKAMVIFVDERDRPTSYHFVDGATIKPRIQILLQWLEQKGARLGLTYDNLDEVAQYASEEFNVDLTNASYVQEINSRIVAAWTSKQMIVDITNNSIQVDKMMYGGGSRLQRSLSLTSAFVNAWEYNQELFRINYPENVLAFFGDYNPDGLEAFKRKIVTEAGPGSWQRLVTIAAGDKDSFDAKIIPLRNTPKEMMFPELLRMIIALKAAAYRMHPSVINMSTDGGNGGPDIGNVNEEAAIADAQEEGFHSLLMNHAALMNRAIVWRWYEDLELVWEGLDKEDEKQKTDINVSQVQYFKTVDEARAEFGWPPLPDGKGKMPLNQILAQQDQAAQQAAMGGAPGAPGAQPGGPQPGKPGQGKPSPGGQEAQEMKTAQTAAARSKGASKGPGEPVPNDGVPKSQKFNDGGKKSYDAAKSMRYHLRIRAGG